MRLLISLCCVSITLSAASCMRDPGSDQRSTDVASEVKADSHRPSPFSDKPRTSNEWVLSSDGKLALQIRVQAPTVRLDESFVVVVEIENRSTERITILRPFGDDFHAVSHGIEIRNAQGKLAYTGSKRSYVIGAGGFTSLEPGASVEDKLALPIDNYAGIEHTGRYLLQYVYSYNGEWDTTAEKG